MEFDNRTEFYLSKGRDQNHFRVFLQVLLRTSNGQTNLAIRDYQSSRVFPTDPSTPQEQLHSIISGKYQIGARGRKNHAAVGAQLDGTRSRRRESTTKAPKNLLSVQRSIQGQKHSTSSCNVEVVRRRPMGMKRRTKVQSQPIKESRLGWISKPASFPLISKPQGVPFNNPQLVGDLY